MSASTLLARLGSFEMISVVDLDDLRVDSDDSRVTSGFRAGGGGRFGDYSFGIASVMGARLYESNSISLMGVSLYIFHF
uniref:Uncharacterized protein n=1 Tax=Kalanchoe fedtschenkoi TaxID=63787 RepID=A0A7N0V3G3_KALFE